MSQENLQTMMMQNFGGLKEVYYGIVQIVNWQSQSPYDIMESLFKPLAHAAIPCLRQKVMK